MTDVYVRGPDVHRLLAETDTNSFATFGWDRAKHYVTCNEDGRMIGTAVLFGLEDDEVSLVARPPRRTGVAKPRIGDGWSNSSSAVGTSSGTMRNERSLTRPRGAGAGGRRTPAGS